MSGEPNWVRRRRLCGVIFWLGLAAGTGLYFWRGWAWALLLNLAGVVATDLEYRLWRRWWRRRRAAADISLDDLEGRR